MSDQLLVSTRKGLFVLTRQRTGWHIEQTAFLGDNVTLSLVDERDGNWYAALNLGHFGVKLQRSSDQGKSWVEVGVPTYAPEHIITTGDGKAPQAATLKLLWSLERGGVNEPGRLWAGTIPGGLFRSDDYGQSWSLIASLWQRPERAQWFGGGYDFPGIHSICVDPADAKKLRIAISCGGVWQSGDAGNSWEVTCNGIYATYMPPERRDDPIVQDPHRMVQCQSNPKNLWIQHHNGIFRSTDGGRNWVDVENAKPSAFGFAVAVHPKDPNTAWFIPAVKDQCRVPVAAKLVVSRTQDGGQSFQNCDKGLPQQDAYDLVYRHGLAIDSTGDRLAFGSTTGNLWVSENQGDTWRNLSNYLPPINAVLFG